MKLQDGTYIKLADGRHARLETDNGYWVATHETTLEQVPIGGLFGIWTDGDTYYFDSVEYHTDLQTALRVAKEHNQLAIWDNGHNEEIRL